MSTDLLNYNSYKTHNPQGLNFNINTLSYTTPDYINAYGNYQRGNLSTPSQNNKGIFGSYTPTSEQYDKALKANIGLGAFNSTVGAINSLTNAGLGIWGAIQASKQYEQAKKQFNYEVNSMNRNLHNQAQLLNAEIANRANMAGIYAGRDNYQTVKDKYYNDNKVDGSAIKA